MLKVEQSREQESRHQEAVIASKTHTRNENTKKKAIILKVNIVDKDYSWLSVFCEGRRRKYTER